MIGNHRCSHHSLLNFKLLLIMSFFRLISSSSSNNSAGFSPKNSNGLMNTAIHIMRQNRPRQQVVIQPSIQFIAAFTAHRKASMSTAPSSMLALNEDSESFSDEYSYSQNDSNWRERRNSNSTLDAMNNYARSSSNSYNSYNQREKNPFGMNSPFTIGKKTDPSEYRTLVKDSSATRTKSVESAKSNTQNIIGDSSKQNETEKSLILNGDEILSDDHITETINSYETKRLDLHNNQPYREITEEGKEEQITTQSSSTADTKAANVFKKEQLKDDLKKYRIQQSKPIQKPAYTIFTNAALEGIYDNLPQTKEELIKVKGIGPKKVDMFGDDIIKIVSKYTACSSSVDNGDNGSKEKIPLPKLAVETIKFDDLTLEQKRAAELFLLDDGGPPKNVFITGSAGTGKSYLLKYLVQELKKQPKNKTDNNTAADDDGGDINSDDDKDSSNNSNVSENSTGNGKKVVGVCAPTGVAAIIAGGSTLHSFFGIGLGKGARSSLLRKVRKSSKAVQRIDETDVLITDECSMVSSDLLETLDFIARQVRNGGAFRDKPFGGMQLVAFGDFFQLPPVYRGDEGDMAQGRDWRPFCFNSPAWSDLGLGENVVELKQVQRQGNEEFISLLNKVRVGDIQESDIRNLNQRCLVSETNPLPRDGILPTRLYVLNRDVDYENAARLEELETKEVVCKARDTWREDMPLGTLANVKKKMAESLDMELPDKIKLKVGAQVMLTRNKDLDKNLVNGSRGVVERFVETSEGPIPIVRFDSGIVTRIDPVEAIRYNSDGEEGCLVRMQVPLKLAWAITIHKSQGSTLTRALLDITSAFEYGQCYVALSRVKSLDGLWLEKPAKLRNVMVSPQVIDFFQTKRKFSP